MIVFGNNEHGQAIADKAGCLFNERFDTIISRTSDGRLLGGILYREFTGGSVRMHVGAFAPNWISKDLLWVAFDYPFNQLGCSKVFGFVRSDNKTALAFDYKLGFKYVTTIPGVYSDADLVVLDMDHASCKWLNIQPRSLQREGTDGLFQ